ncbi:hypothetical protein NP233_g1978 [Leucocoprinus birnbaumii]|uniref:Uncharacterized protein n=1 Tax=Leucocoprinus birnbaumii TaxID=56174 RepID=A0AAD5VZT9_9AGAR|nr:hypothetical protein NP233_g1978 [Leucocoprinus birnbaumii]
MIHPADTLVKPSKPDAFKIDGSLDSATAKKAENWFGQFINDPDVLRSTGVDIDILGRIVALAGAIVDSFEILIYKDNYHEKAIVEISVLRLDHPYFKVYRIEFTAWSASAHSLFVREDQSGITGELNARNFCPRAPIIDHLINETIFRVAKEAEDLFN